MENPANTTLFVKGLPRTTTADELQSLFSDCGPLKRHYVIRDKVTGDPCRGFGYVTFSSREDAEIAIKKVKRCGNQLINVMFANQRSEDSPQVPVKRERMKKTGRLIIRNLPFKATEDTLKEEFQKYGNILKVYIPRKPDKKMYGYGFVEFEKKWDASKAIAKMNMTEMLGRPVAVDWAVSREKYKMAVEKESHAENETVNIKDEDMSDDDLPKVKQESSGSKRAGKVRVKNKEDSQSESDDSDDQSDNDSGLDDDSGDDINSDDDEDDDDDDDDEGDDSGDEEGPPVKKRRLKSDAEDGCTLFLRNLSFDTTNQSLRERLGEFGEVVYALVCIDPDTDHPRGTAFVRYRTQEQAEACIMSTKDQPLVLDGRNVDVYPALSKKNLQKVKEDRSKKEPKDNRNIYLEREGVIFPNSPAAQGVSMHDMKLRQQIQKWKSAALKNVNMFISPVRLYVQNIPDNINDTRLKTVFSKAGGKAAVITEARIMRDMRRLDAGGVGQSKGYGFVTFTRHQDALTALRGVNNNPTIFSKDRRPIVDFSVENHMALKAREKRLDRSKAKAKSKQGKESKNTEDGNAQGGAASAVKTSADGSGTHVDSKKKKSKNRWNKRHNKNNPAESGAQQPAPEHLVGGQQAGSGGAKGEAWTGAFNRLIPQKHKGKKISRKSLKKGKKKVNKKRMGGGKRKRK